MKHKVKLSVFSIVETLIVLALLAGLIWYFADKDKEGILYVLSACVAAWCLLALYYAPMAVSVNEKNLCVHRNLEVKCIPLSEIESIKLCQPTMAERRICGSGGFCGYWGWFSERDLGKYFAYYGKASDCFFVILKDGRKYMLGCENPGEIVEAIEKRIAVG